MVKLDDEDHFRDEVFPCMVYMAVNFAKNHPGYEIDELVNEIYISKAFQTMTHHAMIWKASQWAMNRYHVHIHRKTAYQPTSSLDDTEDQSRFECLRIDYDTVDVIDLIEELSKRLPVRSKRILGMLAEGRNMSEIARLLGLSVERIRQLIEEIRETANKIQAAGL